MDDASDDLKDDPLAKYRPRDMSWKQVAHQAQLSVGGLLRVRKREVKPRANTLRAIEQALELDAGTLNSEFEIETNEGMTWGDVALLPDQNEPDIVINDDGSATVIQIKNPSDSAMIALVVPIDAKLMRELSDRDLRSVQDQLAQYAAFIAGQKVKTAADMKQLATELRSREDEH